MRELAFFPGIARGAAFPGFHYAKETGSRAAELVLSFRENVCHGEECWNAVCSTHANAHTSASTEATGAAAAVAGAGQRVSGAI